MTWHTSTAVYSCCILLLFGSSEIPANIQNMTCSMWYMMRPQILPHPFTCTLIYGTPSEPRLEGNTSWSTLFLIKICGNKMGCKMKTNGYLIFNYRNLDVYEPQCSGFWPFVITHFNATAFLTPNGWQLGFTECPAIVQATLGAVKKCLSFSKVGCCHIL